MDTPTRRELDAMCAAANWPSDSATRAIMERVWLAVVPPAITAEREALADAADRDADNWERLKAKPGNIEEVRAAQANVARALAHSIRARGRN